MATHSDSITHAGAPDSRSVGDILRDIIHDLGRIIRDEAQLARVEFAEKAARARAAGGAFAIAAVSGLLAASCIVTACIAALALVMPVWLAALIMGIVLGVAAGGAYIAGVQRWENVELTPRQTIETLREDMEWAKQQTD